jgi:lipopolysaccharide/colanic/teichoic acid biosynthesis glycosyltransferase
MDARPSTEMARPATAPAIEPRAGVWPALKRVVDVLGSAFGLLLFSPVMAVIAAAIKLDSRGPVFFRQSRLGRSLEEFTVLKFRTMKFDSSPELHRAYIAKLAAGQADEDDLKKLTNDPRVTRVGAFLRRTSLDELPQFVNVFLGHMSIVGPRPAVDYELEHYAERHFERFTVKPGMTGLWQVSGRNRVGFKEMLDLDVDYARTSGPLVDLKILVKTPAAAVSGAA